MVPACWDSANPLVRSPVSAAGSRPAEWSGELCPPSRQTHNALVMALLSSISAGRRRLGRRRPTPYRRFSRKSYGRFVEGKGRTGWTSFSLVSGEDGLSVPLTQRQLDLHFARQPRLISPGSLAPTSWA